MAIIRANKNNNYTIMSNCHFKDKRLSLKAKGLLSQILSLPDEWDYSVDGLVQLNKENETAITSALKELKECGYLIVSKMMPNETESGRIEYVYDVYETPMDALLAKQDSEKQEVEKQGVENLGLEIQGLENQGQLNTNYKQTNNKKTKDKYIVECKEIIDYLNEKTGRRFKPTNTHCDFIRARIREGATIDDFKAVVDKKCEEWLNDSERSQYLRPQTLFGTKFDAYLNAPVSKKKNWRQEKTVAGYWNSNPVRNESSQMMTADELRKAQEKLASRGSRK